jgi:hypothetical protein
MVPRIRKEIESVCCKFDAGQQINEHSAETGMGVSKAQSLVPSASDVILFARRAS